MLDIRPVDVIHLTFVIAMMMMIIIIIIIIIIITYLLIPWSRALLEKLTDIQLVKKFSPI